MLNIKKTRELARPIECANIEAGSICGTSCHDHECDRINCLPDCATIEFQVHLFLSKHTYDVTKDTEKTHEEFHGILSGNCFRANLGKILFIMKLSYTKEDQTGC